MSRSRTVRVGIAIGAIYLAVLVASSALTDQHVRPLFEGIGPSAPYRWVSPPKEFAAANQPPTPLAATVPIDQAGSLNTPDGQAIVNYGAGALGPHDGDTTVDAKIDPLDPATFAPLPAPLRADGNAYRVSLTYSPSGTPVTTLTAPGNIALQVPEPGQAIFYSADGRAWQRLDSHNVGQPTLLGATFTSPGIYLAGTSAPASTTTTDSSKWPAYAAIAATVVFAVVLLIVTQLRRHRRPRKKKRTH